MVTRRTAFQKLKDSITEEQVMSLFYPIRPVIVKDEASFLGSLSVGLFQTTEKVCNQNSKSAGQLQRQKKTYSQTEKGSLAQSNVQKRMY